MLTIKPLKELSWQEWAAVAGVGLLIGMAMRGTVRTMPLTAIAGAYVAGYAARQMRPPAGYLKMTGGMINTSNP